MHTALAHNHQKVHAFLRHHPMGILSTVAADGTPWGAAIYYVSDDDFNFYFVTRVETFKYQNIEHNPFAAITIADDQNQTTVQATGTITRVPVKDYMNVIFDKLAKIKPQDDHNWAPPLTKIHEGNYMPLQLTPTQLQYANYKEVKNGVQPNYIEKIITPPADH